MNKNQGSKAGLRQSAAAGRWCGRGFHGQSGSTAIEFAIVQPLLIFFLYSTVVYSFVYVLQQSMNFAAQQGAQAAVAVIPGQSVTTSQQYAQAVTAIDAVLNWLPNSWLTSNVTIPSGAVNCPTNLGASSSISVYPVEVDFSLSGVFPSLIILPGVSTGIPPLPAKLVGCAVAFD